MGILHFYKINFLKAVISRLGMSIKSTAKRVLHCLIYCISVFCKKRVLEPKMLKNDILLKTSRVL